MHDEDLAKGITKTFLDDTSRQIETMRRHLDVPDAESFANLAHSIKGASANVGGEALRALAFEVEKAARAGDLISAAYRMDDLESEFARLKDAMTSPYPQHY